MMMTMMIMMATLLVIEMMIGGSHGQGSEATDQAALLAMKARWTSTNGFDAGWTSATLPCAGSWASVLCASNRVTALDMNTRAIRGDIATEIGRLDRLFRVNFFNNQLTGTIPTQIADLTSLTQLRFEACTLTTLIPSELGNMSQLSTLQLGSNQMRGTIPSQLGMLINLSILELRNNLFTGSIPSQLSNLIRLNTLDLTSNSFSGTIPSQLGALTGLPILNLATNQLTGTIPPELCVLTRLSEIALFTNQLSGSIPFQLGNLTRLAALRIQGNKLSGTVPLQMVALSALSIMILQSNQLSGAIPSNIGNLTRLVQLNMANNRLSGTIPTQLGVLTRLITFTMNNNYLSGTIPSEVESRCTAISSFGNKPFQCNFFVNPSASSCILSSQPACGSCPAGASPSTANFPPGQCFVLGTNNETMHGINLLAFKSNLVSIGVSGMGSWSAASIRPCFDRWSHVSCLGQRVTSLVIVNQGLVGSIAPNLGFIDSLQILDLSFNQLSSSIPPQLCSTSLATLLLNDNDLVGDHPAICSQLQLLTNFDTERNSMNSVTPFPGSARIDRDALLAFRNSLASFVPSAFLGWQLIPNMNSVNASWSNVGFVSQSMRVTSLSLIGQQLQGSIATDLGRLFFLQRLFLSNNRLSGLIPSQLGFMTRLTLLDVSVNFLSGVIPSQVETRCAAIASSSNKAFRCNFLTGPTSSNCTVSAVVACSTCPSGSSPAVSNTPPGQCFTSGSNNETLHAISLLAFKSGLTSFGSSNISASWLSSSMRPCFRQWTHVSCLAQRVTSVVIQNRGLLGNIASEFGLIDSLQFLDLSGNQLLGRLASEFGMLFSLQRLSLANNRLSGSLPSEIGLLTRLTSIDVSINYFSGAIPAQVENRCSTILSLGNKAFRCNVFTAPTPSSCLPSQAACSTCLPDSSPVVTNIPPGQCFFPAIRNETIDAIALLSFKAGLISYGQSSINSVWTSSSQPCSNLWAHTVCSAMRVTSIILSNLNISGVIATELGTMNALELLNLSFNRFSSSIPLQISLLSRLSLLSLQSNRLNGNIPTQLCNQLPLLTSLLLNDNLLEGSVPAACSTLTSLSNFDVERNSFGAVTPFPGSYRIDRDMLLVLRASFTSSQGGTFAGWVSSPMIFSVNSSWANIGFNPTSLRVTAINLASRQLQGTVASEIGRIYFLRVFSMATNAIASIPSTLGQLTQLTSIDVSSNKLVGTIPMEVEALCAIASTVRFECNYFHAPRPSVCMPSSASQCLSCPTPTLGFSALNPLNGFYGQCGFSAISDISPSTILAGVPTAITVFGSNFASLISDVYDIKCVINGNTFIRPTSVAAGGNSLVCLVAATSFPVQISVSNHGSSNTQSVNSKIINQVGTSVKATIISKSPDSLRVQTPTNFVLTGLNFVNSSTTVCILGIGIAGNTYVFTPSFISSTRIECEMTWPIEETFNPFYLAVGNVSLSPNDISDPVQVSLLPPCESGFYSVTSSTTTTCAICPTYMTSQRASTSVFNCTCNTGFYLVDAVNLVCEACVEGMTCPGNNVVVIQPGYWRSGENVFDIISCSSTSCSGSEKRQKNSGSGLTRCSGSNSSASLCADGYTGPLCAVCASRYSKLGSSIDPFQVHCIECPDEGLNVLALLVLIAFAFLLAYALVKSATYEGDIDAKSSEQKAAHMREASLRVIFKVLLNYLQVLYYLGRLASNWSDLASRFLDAVGIVGAMSPSNYTVQCAADWRFYDNLLLVYISPAIVIGSVMMVYAIRNLIKKVDFKQTKTEFQLAVMVILYQIHPTIMLEVLSSFPCLSVAGTGTSYLKRDMNVDCKSSEYHSYTIVSALFLVVYVAGILVLTVMRLRHNYNAGKLSSPGHHAYQKYAFFFLGYRSQAYYWEAVIMLRKMIIVVFSVLAAPMLQLLFGIVVIHLSMGVNMLYAPFASAFVNRIETFSLIALYITIILGFLFLYSCGRDDTVWIAVILILVNTGTVFFILATTIQRMQDQISNLILYLPDWLVSVEKKADAIVMTPNPHHSNRHTRTEMTAF